MTLSKENRSKERDREGEKEDISYAKVVILGASGVGKSSIIEVV